MERFYIVYDKLNQALDGMPYDELGISDEVKEQVELMVTDHSLLKFLNDQVSWVDLKNLHATHDFMGGSHNSMITLENRVGVLERVIADMTLDLAGSSGRRPTTFMNMFEGSSNMVLGKYNNFPDYSGTKLGRVGDGWATFSERFLSSDSYSYDAP
ncbi:hypothetical protein GIB67_039850 [Kingdonia uniflora]|uniref:PUB 12/19-like N-terminal domain-containing protein n=1 Tax=Kingdonia uniflora TaxID=39325 RepID=A0A7J7P372_9MAGN|nr:hypothetical protein GIB67_039850 [Kingdonia uniflora]